MIEIDSIYSKCITTSEDSITTARMVSRFVRSPFALYCDLFVPKKYQDDIDPYVKHLADSGLKFEKEVVEKKYPDAVSAKYETREEGFKIALQMMVDGKDFIYNMPLFYLPLGLSGVPDILIKCIDGNSIFGNYYYKVCEIKLSKHIHSYHKLQAVYYNRMIGAIQGYESPHFCVLNGSEQSFEFESCEYSEKLDEVLRGVREILGGKKIDPCYGSSDNWQTYGNDLLIASRDISLISGIGPSMKSKMIEIGMNTIDDVSCSTVVDLQKINGIGQKKAISFLSKSKALVSGKPVTRNKDLVNFKQTDVEIFLDLEGTDPILVEKDYSVFNYLIGIVRREDDECTYTTFVAKSHDEEKAIISKFCEYIGAISRDCVIYHWHNYDRKHLERMMEYYDVDSSLKENVIDKLVDLSPIAVGSYAYPTYSDGLKDIAEYLGFKWRQKDVGALSSMVLYWEYLESKGKNEKGLDEILMYNEDDCLAVMWVKDCLSNGIESI